MPLPTDLPDRSSDGSASTDVAEDFGRVAQSVPPDVLGKGLSAAFGSSATPAVGDMVAQMFGASSPEQRAALLNRLGAALGPAASSVLGGLLAPTSAAGAPATVTPGQAAKITPQQVEDVVARAERHDPGVVGHLSDFYAQHPMLVRTLGSAALAIALAKISEHVKAR